MKSEYNLNDSLARIRKGGSYFDTFIDRDTLAAGLLVLRPGEADTQEPHDSDEVYLVLSGDGYLSINGRDYSVSRDKLFFVKRGARHHFYGNKRELRVLYFFGGP